MGQKTLRSGLPVVVSMLVIGGWTFFSQSGQVGYGVLDVGDQDAALQATALLSSRNDDGVLTWEAAVPAVEPLARGRIFVDRSRGARTALALTNPSDEEVEVDLTLRDSMGGVVASEMETIGPRMHLALFVGQLFHENLPDDFIGSLTFETSSGERRLAAITLRESSNRHLEPIFTTLPVADLDRVPEEASLVFPHIGAGETLSTQLILSNPTSEKLSGEIRFTDFKGEKLVVMVNDLVRSEFGYEIEPHGTLMVEMTWLRASGMLQTGYAVVTLEEGLRLPEGTAIFRFLDQGSLVSEAGVDAVRPTTRSVMFVDNTLSGTGARTRTALAAASPDNPQGKLRFRLLDRFGVELDAADEQILANGHLNLFIDELFPRIPVGFTGYLEVATDFPIHPVSLKLTINERGDPILAALRVVDLTRPRQPRQLIFPRLGFGDGLETRLILFNTDPEIPVSGRLLFRTADGLDWTLQMGDRTQSEFDFEIPLRGGSTFRPGSMATPDCIFLNTLDPGAKDLVIDEEHTILLRPRVVDSDRSTRDDFTVTFMVTDPEVATVDASNHLRGNKRGMTTLQLRAGGLPPHDATVSVVRVSSGAGVGDLTSVVQDLSNRLYLANTPKHVILLADGFSGLPVVIAGAEDTPGLRDGPRQEARFDGPTYMAIDQKSGDIYIADSGNHVIRVLSVDGTVRTYAGSGQQGSGNGARLAARFNNPQGLALDSHGRLWVVDSGNHTVRIIDPAAEEEVATVAGKAGQAGSSDGFGEDARFSNPIGIAIESETYVDTVGPFKRELVSVFVADTGNGLIRRVLENGRVETLSTGTELSASRSGLLGAESLGEALKFQALTDVFFDAFGNLFVSEPGEGRIRVILPDRTVVSAAESDPRFATRGMIFVPGGRLLAATVSRSNEQASLRAIEFGIPEITAVDQQPAPLQIRQRLRRGGVSQQVIIEGRNFSHDAAIVISGEVIEDVMVIDSRNLSFALPELRSGQTTLTVKGRAGLAHAPLVIEPIDLTSLPAGFVTTAAGGASFEWDLAPAATASLAPSATAVDNAGNLYIADSIGHRIRRVDVRTQTITTIAGTGLEGDSGDGEPALQARLDSPQGLAVGRTGNLFIADTSNNKIRRVDAGTGLITTFAGTGEDGTSGDGGPATQAAIENPQDLAVDREGNLFVATQNRIRRIEASSGTIETIAGGEQPGFSGDGGPAAAALLNAPLGVAVDATGNIYIADSRNYRIRRVDALSCLIETIAGDGNRRFFGDGGPATSASLDLPSDIAVDGQGSLFIADQANQRIRRVDFETQIISTVAGNGEPGFSGDGGPAAAAVLNTPFNLSSDGSGNLYISDSLNLRVRRIDSATGVITTVAGNGWAAQSEGFSGDRGEAFAATLSGPQGMAFSPDGSLYIADSANHRIRRIDSRGIIDTVAGNGIDGFSGDGGPALDASLSLPSDVVVDDANALFIADRGNHRIRHLDLATGIIRTVAGTGQPGSSGDGGPATAAQLRVPFSVAIDGEGNLFIADTGNNLIRMVEADSETIHTIAGTGVEGFSGDGSTSDTAALAQPSGIAVDPSGRLLAIADRNNNRVRLIDLRSGMIETVGGQGGFGVSGDFGPAILAPIERPYDVAFDAQGNLYVVCPYVLNPENGLRDGSVRRIDAATGMITTVAGSGNPLVVLDGVLAIESGFQQPMGLAVDDQGNLFISELQSDRVRVVRGPLQ